MIDREFTILKALYQQNFPVPKALILCDNDSIIGTPFYIMNFVKGRILRNATLPNYTPQQKQEIYREAIKVLAQLHSINWKQIGLETYGRSGNYYQRQIHVWGQQYEASKTNDIPEMNKIMEWLPKNIPSQSETDVSIVHGDFRLENVIFHETESKIVSCLDWELSTLGHPFSDLTYFYIDILMTTFKEQEIKKTQGLVPPSSEEFLSMYCKFRNIPQISQEEWEFYLVFTLFRCAAIAQGVYKRALQGNASAENAKEFLQNVFKSSKYANDVLEKRLSRKSNL